MSAGRAGRSAALAGLIGAIAPLRPVSLADVLDEAGLQTRVDRKYLVDLHAFVALVQGLPDRFSALEIGGRRAFRYESVYFDSPDRRLYRQHVQGRRRRYKVRTRAYLDSGECSLEVKLKGGRSETVKSRVPYPLDARTRLTPDGRAFLAERLLTEYGVDLRLDLRPALTTTYRRATLVDLEGQARLTCDVDLTFTRGSQVAIGPAETVLVESKTAGRSGAADLLLRDLGVRPIRVSKYAVASALLDPDLPANPWHRTLRLFDPSRGATAGTVGS